MRVWTRAHPAAVATWALFLAGLVLGWRFAPDEAAVRGALESAGPLAPLGFVVAEAVQVIVIPIPGQPLEIPGGYLFGLVPGIILASIGAFIGSIAAFAIGRRYGRPWVERRIPEEVRGRFEGWMARGERIAWIVFWLMVIPAFPRDPLCYLAGLTPLGAGRFALIAAIGRPVGLAPWVALGSDGVVRGAALQLWLVAGAAVVWFLHVWIARLSRWRAPERRVDPTLTAPDNGDRDA